MRFFVLLVFLVSSLSVSMQLRADDTGKKCFVGSDAERKRLNICISTNSLTILDERNKISDIIIMDNIAYVGRFYDVSPRSNLPKIRIYYGEAKVIFVEKVDEFLLEISAAIQKRNLTLDGKRR